jgi:glycosyltransferase involved in cell wall biosynthesis
MPRALKKAVNCADIFYSPFFNIPGGIRVPVYTTIHDIIFPDMPELTSPWGLKMRMFFFRRAFRHSQAVFTVSEFSKSRITHYLGTKTPVIVTHSAIQPWLLNARSSSFEKKNDIVFIGNIKKHKGLDYLLEALSRARAEGLPHRLVIIGSGDGFRTSHSAVMQKIESLGTGAVFFTGHVSDEQLAGFIAGAALLVQPSLYEGFGLPPLEAMVLGTGALISDIPAFKEIYARFPVTFFKAGDPEDLKNKLMELLYRKKRNSLLCQRCCWRNIRLKKPLQLFYGSCGNENRYCPLLACQYAGGGKNAGSPLGTVSRGGYFYPRI